MVALPSGRVLSDHYGLSIRRATCRYGDVGYFGGTAAGPNHAFSSNITLTSARYLATSINFVGDTLPRASAPRDNLCRKSAEKFSLVYDLCKSDGRICIYARSSSTSGARETSLRKRTDRSFRALITWSMFRGRKNVIILNL